CPPHPTTRRCAMSGTESNRRPPAVQSAKITDTHRSKLAVVYVRQSTPQQVAENPESLARQYALADHARALGWLAELPRIVDEELGPSRRAEPIGDEVLDHLHGESHGELVERTQRTGSLGSPLIGTADRSG